MYQELALEVPAEYQALKESAHRFAKEVLRPASIELDRLADLSSAKINGLT